MAKGTLGQVVQLAISDAAFRNRLRSDPNGALSGFDLSPDERAAIQSGDPTKLASLGVDQRMSKAFAMGEATGASRIGGSDVAGGAYITSDEQGGASERGILASNEGGSGSGGGAYLTSDELGNAVDQSAVASGGGFTGGGTAAHLTSDEQGNASDQRVDTAGSFEGGGTTAYLTSDERGGANDQSAVASGGGSVGGEGTAFMTSDEMGNAVDQSAVASGAGGFTGGGNSAYLTADERGSDQATPSSDAARADPDTFGDPHPTS